MRDIYQHCDEKHLHRYVAEFDFRYNHRVKLGYSDGERAALAVAQCPTPNTVLSVRSSRRWPLQSWLRLFEQIFRVDKWSLCRD